MRNDLVKLSWRRARIGVAAAGLMAAILAVGGTARADDAAAAPEKTADQMHAEVLDSELFPSASKCMSCHEEIYKEWSSSNHAYASISPMFHKFEQTINAIAPTINTFCVRCHAAIGTTMGEAREMPVWERSQVSREGVSCITCHRVSEAYYKVNGSRNILPGKIFEPVYGPIGGEGVAEVVKNKDGFKVATNENERGNQIHTEGKAFPQLSKSEFCVSCHQVAVNLGIKLEVVWDQYRGSPALAEGITCQDCHMGKEPGVPSGYKTGAVAVVNGQPVNENRVHHDHSFPGPGYPTAHPGIFPHNPKAERWTMDQWLQFNYRQPWGDSEWEDKVEEGEIAAPEFPEVWSDRFDREEAREIINENIEGIERKRELRHAVMENGSHVDGPFFDGAPRVGRDLDFTYIVHNTNRGHNLPSGSLGAQPEVWLNVALIDPDGKNIWESGYVDSVGDMADNHSHDVLTGKVPYDDQLVNLQTKFLTTNVKGTDREMYLPVNVDIDQLPFLRPPAQPTTVINHPPFVRMEGRSIPPLGKRDANYSVPGELLSKPGKYKLAFRVRSRAEPIYFMSFVGATNDMKRSMNEWMLDYHAYQVEFEVKG